MKQAIAKGKLDFDNVTALTPRRKDVLSEQAIAERIAMAVMDHRLPPGTKLPENVLCASFAASRARIRRVLLMLAQRRIVELRANRGAYVASPSPIEARDLFQARRAIEAMVAANAAQRIDDAQIARLRDHVDRELAAAKAGHGHDVIQLSGKFHVLLAEFAGNPVLTRFVEELVARTSLVIALFASRQFDACPDGEHHALIEAVAGRDGERASRLMIEHLDHIEGALDLDDGTQEPVDLRRVFG